MWNHSLEASLRVDANTLTTVIERTHGFSFAYLKELCLSSLVYWFHERDRAIAPVLLEQVDALHKQMQSV